MEPNEIKNYIENQIAYHCDEFGLEREEVTEVVLLNCIEYFYRDELSEEDLLECAKYLAMEIDVESARKEKAIRIERRAKRKARVSKK